MIIPLLVLIAVFVLIAVRQVGNLRLQIWQVMLGGAITVLLTFQITPLAALKSINLDVMIFLACMFIIGQALEQSGYLSYLSYKFFRRARSMNTLLLFVLFGAGIFSAILMNDTLAIIGTPVVLLLARKHNIHAKVLLLALAFAITIGGVMSPLGNPQNFLIATGSNMSNPFWEFAKHLFIPTMISLLACYFLLRIMYKENFHDNLLIHEKPDIRDRKLMNLSRLSLIILGSLSLLKIVTGLMVSDIDIKMTYIVVAAALPLLVLSRKRLSIIRRIDWRTLVFFAAMFVLMESAWQTGFFQSIISSAGINITSVTWIFIISILLSQLISNVPLVALYLPMLMHAGAGTKGLLALAAGSTIAGSFLILGAASNVIIIQTAENSEEKQTLTFWEFAKAGIPLTIICALIYWVFLAVI